MQREHDRYGACSTLIEGLGAAARTKRGVTFIRGTTHEEVVSYGELLVRGDCIAAHLRREGMVPGDELVMQLDDNRSFLEVFWGCLLTGVIPVPLTVGARDEHRMKVFRVWRKLRRPRIVASAEVLSSLREFGMQSGLCDEAVAIDGAVISLDGAAADGAAAERRLPQPDDVAFIQFSSGSTGTPKGVVLSHRNLVVNATAINQAMETTASDSVVSWMPLTHDMGLIAVHLSAVLAGIDQRFMSPALFVRNPTFWMDKVSEHRATQLYSPNFGCSYLLRHLGAPDSHAWDLSSVRVLMNGAEPISAELCSRFLRVLARYGLRSNIMLPAYGLAEATVVVSISRVGAELAAVSLKRESVAVGCQIEPCEVASEGVTFVEVGTAVSGCSLRIASAAAVPVPDGVVGHIQIRGESVTRGYYHDPDATAAVVTHDGWLDTGDLGFMRAGRLVITGRTKDIIFANGQNLYPHDLERIVENAAGIDTGYTAVCGVPDAQGDGDDVVLFMIHKSALEHFVPIAVSARRALGKNTGIWVKAVVPVETLPRTTSGKIQRYQLSEAYRSGKYAETLAALETRIGAAASDAEQAPRDSQEAAVLRIWRDALDDDTAGMESNFFDRGGGSLAALRLSEGLARELGVEIAIAELLRMTTPRELAADLVARAPSPLPELERTTPAETYPITSTQRRVFLLEQSEAVGTAYNLPIALEITGEIEIPRLARALSVIVQRHEALRTAFVEKDGDIRQRVLDDAPVELVVEPCSRAALDDALAGFVQRFDLGHAPLLRARLFALAPDEHVLALDVHHIVSDGVSYELLLRELSALYRGCDLTPVSVQFRDYAVWLQHPVVEEFVQNQGAFWAEALGGELPMMNMPCDFARPPRQTFRGDTVTFEIGQHALAGVQRVAARSETTPFVVLLAAYAVVLSRYCGQEDLVVGTVAMARPRPALRGVMGMFVNTLGLRLRVDRRLPFGELLARVRIQVLDALAHQDYPFAALVDRVAGMHAQGRNPLFDTLLLMQDLDLTAIDWGGHQVALRRVPHRKALFDFRLEAVTRRDGLTIHLEYRTDLFRRVTMERMARRIDGVLRQIAQDPSAPLSNISMLLEEEPGLLSAYNQTEAPVPAATLHGLFARQVAARGSHAAVVLDGESLSYAELDARSSQVAHWLHEKGVRRGAYVGVLAQRRPSTLIYLLGVLKAGAAYVPVDPEYPQERQDYILRHSGAALLLRPEVFPAGELERYPQEAQSEEHPADVAYVIYTSGSTGRPKGVVITHQAAANTVQDINARFGVTGEDRILGLSSLCFDLSVYDVFGALAAGATLVQIPDQRDVPEVARVLVDERITVWNSVPAIMDMLVENVEGTFQSAALELVMLSGDWIGLGLPGKVVRHFPAARCISLGGATEASIWSIYHPIDGELDPQWRSIPYGRPLANQTIYVLDVDRNPCPVGIEGEIYIGGAGLAVGYHADPEWTAAAFVQHARYGRVYRTGDHGRFHHEGYVEFCGRTDDQVKINGFRIELEEIEHRLLLCPAVQAAKVLAEAGKNGMKTLCAYVVLTSDVPVSALQEPLSASLPAYMVPSVFRRLDRLPLTFNGKVDLRALREVAQAMENDDPGEQPSDAIEAQILLLWSEQLGVQVDGVNRRFLDLGGSSLAAANQVTAIQKAFRVEIPFRLMFGNPSVREVADRVRASRHDAAAPIQPAPVAEFYPVSAAQRRVFLANQIRGADLAYNMPGAFRLRGSVDHQRLANAFRALVARHEVFRTGFRVHRDEVVQVVRPTAELDVPLLVTGEFALPEILRAWAKPFDLGRPPLLRGALVRLASDDHVLGIDLHHIVSDGETISAVLEELDRLYRGEQLPPPALQYRDYACWAQRFQDTERYRKQAEFWKLSFATLPRPLDLPIDHQRQNVLVRPGGIVDFAAPDAVAAAVSARAAASSASPAMVLLAAFGSLLSLWTGREDVVIGLPVAGRSHPSLARIPGMFVNLLPVRTRPCHDKPFSEYLAEVKEAVLRGHENQDYPFDELVKDLALPGNPSRNPVFDVAFSPQGTPGAGLSLAGIPLQPLTLHNETSKFDLTLMAFADGPKLGFSFEYDSLLFERASVNQLGEAYLAVLRRALSDPDTRIADLSGRAALATKDPDLESLTFAL